MELLNTLAFITAGLLSGVMNTLASSGSAITLPVMIFLGIPPSIANATNRLPILVSSAISVRNFNKSKNIIWPKTIKISVPIVLGTLVGSALVRYLNPEKLQVLVLFALILSFILIITNSKRILKGKSVIKKISPKNYILFFFIGIWAGLIVLDSAMLMLFELIIGCGLDLTKANPIKNFLLLMVSIFSILIFYQNHLINWKVGFMLSIGSFCGGYFASKLNHSDNKHWIYVLLIAILSVEIMTLAIKILLN